MNTSKFIVRDHIPIYEIGISVEYRVLVDGSGWTKISSVHVPGVKIESAPTK